MRKSLLNLSEVPGFSGAEDAISVAEWMVPDQEAGLRYFEPDLVAMAQWALRYLVGNPQPPLGHQCRFDISPLDCPPAFSDVQPDPVAVGDTENRMELEFIYMREMTGETIGREVEEAIQRRIESYVQDDGLCWCNARCMGESVDSPPAAMSWTTGHLLRSCAERFRLTGDERYVVLGRRLVQGLRGLATECGPLQWYEGGLAGWRDGDWLPRVRCHYPALLDPLIHFVRVTGEKDALGFAEAIAEGIIAGAQEHLERYRVLNDGSHCSGNCHLTMRAALGVAQAGVETGNSRFIEWARRVYEFTRSYGTDWGWYPENMLEPDKRYWSETCVTGDMVESAIAFAGAGHIEYWDHVERTVRNYLPEAQFFITPEFERFYRETHAQRTSEEVDASLQLLQRFEGGFLARQRPSDWVYRRDGRLQINMMGCCPPEGMRSLYLAWRHTVVEKDGHIFVNMRLDRHSAAARVVTRDVHPGRLRVEALISACFHLRPPFWTLGSKVEALHNGRKITPAWKKGYVVFDNVRSGDVLELLYPVPRFTQTVKIGCERAEEFYQVHWLGNEVSKVTPRGDYLPIFTGRRRPLPELPRYEAAPLASVEKPAAMASFDWNPAPA